MIRPASPGTVERTSALLERVLDELPGERASIGHILTRLEQRSFGGVIVLLSILGLIPGLSFFAGLAMLIPAAQMALGYRAPVLPALVREREVDIETLRALAGKAIPWIERIERVVKPRWILITAPPMTSVVGVAVIALALVMLLPLPLSNLPPAIALLLLALGVLERDGLMLAVGLVIAALALAIGVLVAQAAYDAAAYLVQKYVLADP